MASKLGMSLQQCQEETSSTEFVEWMVFLELELNDSTKQEYYLAQIAQVIAQVNSKDSATARSIKLKDFLLNFKPSNASGDDDEKMTEEEIQAHMEASKAAWKAILSVDRKRVLPPKGS